MRIKNLWLPIVILSYLPVLFIAAYDLFAGVKVAIYTALVYLALALIPARLVRWNLFKGEIRRKLALVFARRKQFGISTGFMVFLHSALAILAYSGIRENAFSFNFFVSREIFLGFAAEIIFLVMVITSIGSIISLLDKKWKPLHRLVWVAVIFGLIHSQLASKLYTGSSSNLAFLFFTVFIIAAVLDLILAVAQKRSIKVAVITLLLIATGFSFSISVLMLLGL